MNGPKRKKGKEFSKNLEIKIIKHLDMVPVIHSDDTDGTKPNVIELPF